MVPVAPMRKEAAHRTEMVSQLLFGEIAEVLEETLLFTRIRCLYDGYEGWCQKTQLAEIDINRVDLQKKQLTANWLNAASLNGYPMYLSLGTPLTIFNDSKAQIGNYTLSYSGKIQNPETAVFTEEAIKSVSMLYLNTGYLWGGRSVFGIDCSGFVQQVFRFFNKHLPRDAYQQAEQGEVVGFLQEVKCGDLAFFDNEEGKITHVGLLFDEKTIIHSSGKVRIDPIDNMGIVSSDTGERTHKLRVIKRYY
jgi:cell wall-associated NlpC family hydrolase